MTTRDRVSTTTVLLDGTRLRIRPINADDTEALQAMHRGLSARTVQQRFFAALPELSTEQAERFSHVDGSDRVALVAEDPAGRLVAVARYDRLQPGGDEAEVAVVVADGYQHHGLGTLLVTMLRSHASRHGIVDLVADVLVTNRAMQRTFVLAGLKARASYDLGVVHLVMPVS
jgi:acetyltransferase